MNEQHNYNPDPLLNYETFTNYQLVEPTEIMNVNGMIGNQNGGGFAAAEQQAGDFQNLNIEDLQLPESQGSGYNLGSLSFSQMSQGTLDALMGPMGSSQGNLFPIASTAGNGGPIIFGGDDEFFGESELLASGMTTRSILGNKFGGKKILESQLANNGAVGSSEDEVSSSQSSDISQEAKIPSLEPYPGKYNFLVKLGQNTNKKTAVYSHDLNKLYCNNDIKILFNIHLDYKGKPAAMKDLLVKAEVVFTENMHIMEPVKRCITCVNKEAESSNVRFTSINEDHIFNHVVRVCDHPAATHERNAKLNRYYAAAPLERPQLGSTTISRNYEFKCLNTCFEKAKAKEKGRKKLSIIFSLMENNKPIGRSVMELKVCSCPTRDYKNENNKLAQDEKKEKPVKAKQGTRKRPAAEAQIDEEEKLDVACGGVEKQRCMTLPPVNKLSIKSEPGTSGAAGEQKMEIKEGKPPNPFSLSDDSEVELSQSQGASNWSQDSFTTRTLKKLAPKIRMWGEIKTQGPEEDQLLADATLGNLKTFIRTSEKYIMKRRNSSPAGTSGRALDGQGEQNPEQHGDGSPDSGVNAKTP